MNRVVVLLLLVLSANCFSQTQGEMNREAYTILKKSDRILNEVYQQILQVYKKDTLFLQNLKKSQRIWIQFRDAELAMKYPDYPDYIYGSIHPMCRASYLKNLTEKRTETLKIWLTGIEEGDACSGSVNAKN
ncbi:lysozyme inhibitor LprI family protein [Aquimarina sp. I32.4]|uniref:lysozyme inhibitor LprI family protein n=1 Tax=Aquimarina sp. I32.4 TaxID=2053903 RepID=UPI000CDF1FBF|nr:lysozyme inhibitor LprI family protein [Aquimarina sp. I32.4]